MEWELMNVINDSKIHWKKEPPMIDWPQLEWFVGSSLDRMNGRTKYYCAKNCMVRRPVINGSFLKHHSFPFLPSAPVHFSTSLSPSPSSPTEYWLLYLNHLNLFTDPLFQPSSLFRPTFVPPILLTMADSQRAFCSFSPLWGSALTSQT